MSELIEFSQPIYKSGCVCAPYKDTSREPRDVLQFSKDDLDNLKQGVIPADIVVQNLTARDPDLLYITPQMEAVETRDVARSGLCVFRNFVGTPSNAEGAVRFTDAYGFLDPEDIDRTPSGFFLIRWLAYQESMKNIVERYEEGGMDLIADDLPKFQQAKFSGRLVLEKTGRFVLQPPSLWAYMWLEFGLFITNQTGIRQCDWCGTWFPFGTGTSRRSKAKFCADKCRKASHAYAKKQNSN
jgi:hypothetical protein